MAFDTSCDGDTLDVLDGPKQEHNTYSACVPHYMTLVQEAGRLAGHRAHNVK